MKKTFRFDVVLEGWMMNRFNFTLNRFMLNFSDQQTTKSSPILWVI